MIKKLSLAALIIFSLAPSSQAIAKPAAAASAKSAVVHLEKSGDSFEIAVQKEVAKAKAAHLAPYLEFTATWCPPCNAFKKYLHDPLMEDALAGTYLIMVDFDDFAEAAAALKVTGIPTWIELDSAGKATTRRITSSVWGDDIPTNMAPPLKAFFKKS